MDLASLAQKWDLTNDLKYFRSSFVKEIRNSRNFFIEKSTKIGKIVRIFIKRHLVNFWGKFWILGFSSKMRLLKVQNLLEHPVPQCNHETVERKWEITERRLLMVLQWWWPFISAFNVTDFSHLWVKASLESSSRDLSVCFAV